MTGQTGKIQHVFRNTPFGRELLLQSIYCAKRFDLELRVYIPKARQFLMYFKNRVVTVELSGTFLTNPDSARQNAGDIISSRGLRPVFIEPRGFTASEIPELGVDVDMMCFPRSISELSTRVRLGHIGSKVRSVINYSSFPVVIPSPVFKPWQALAVFYGGSEISARAVKLGLSLSKKAGVPMKLFTYLEGGRSEDDYRRSLDTFMQHDPAVNFSQYAWTFFSRGSFRENLFQVEHNDLVITGAWGNSIVKEMIFGSKAEEIQTVLPNNLIIVGPHCVV